MENNPLNDTHKMSETPSSTRRQRRKRKRKEFKNEEYKMGDISSSDCDDTRNKPSSAFGQRRRTKRKYSYGEKYKMEHNPFNDTDRKIARQSQSRPILLTCGLVIYWKIFSLW